jgi:hypothetical protein
MNELLLGRKALDGDGAGETISELEAGEQCSEAVQALSAAGVSSRISENDTADCARSLTCGRTRGIYFVFRDLITLHPSINLFRLHHISPYSKEKLSFIRFDEPSNLSLSYNRLHLVRLNVFIQVPFAYLRPVLSNSSGVNYNTG